MKKIVSLGLAALLVINAVMLTAGAAAEPAASDSNTLKFDFTNDDSGFVPIFADYPDTEDVEDFYEFQHSYGVVPVPGAGKGLFISGNNHSDDLFMGYVKKLEGFAPGRTYHFSVNFHLATNVDGGLIGVGGSPGASVFVKCGVTTMEPRSSVLEPGTGEHFRMNIDTGAQANGGKDMVVVGDMTKAENNRPGEYEFKEFQAEFEVASNTRGEVYLIIATDSGFEATTSYYLDDIVVDWKDTVQPTVTRGQGAQMLFHAADRANADPKDCKFQDVATDHPNAEAITWAQRNGYMCGYGNGRFGPDDSMTVEQAMVMIYRFFGSPAADLSVLDKVEGSNRISPWAKNAVAWAIASGIFKPAKTISPQSPITVEELTYSIGQIVVAA